jgi:hypothetical protein
MCYYVALSGYRCGVERCSVWCHARLSAYTSAVINNISGSYSASVVANNISGGANNFNDCGKLSVFCTE